MIVTIIDPFDASDGRDSCFVGGWVVMWGVLRGVEDWASSSILWDWFPFAAPVANMSRLLTFEASPFGNQVGLFAVGQLREPSSPLVQQGFSLTGRPSHCPSIDVHRYDLGTLGSVGRREILLAAPLVGCLIRFEP